MAGRLIISAAHTLMSPGEVYGDLREADLTRKIIKMLVPHLQKQNIEHKVVPLDLHLLKRIDWINGTGYSEETDDLLLEIHINDGGKRGIEAWYSGKDEQYNRGKVASEFILEELTKKTKHESQGAKSEYDHELGSLLILNQTKPISIAFELLYIDNDEDNKILKDDKKLDELSKALAESLSAYFSSDKSKPDPNAPKKAPDKAPNFPGVGSFGGPSNFSNSMDKKSPFDFDAGDDDSSSKSGNMIMDREERKKMIIDTYKKLLGKEPKQSDINYFLNAGITEEELVKRVFKSKDHKQLVENAKEYDELKKTSSQMESDLLEQKGKLADLEEINRNLNNLLQYKNYQIAQMNNVLIVNGVIREGEFFDFNNPNKYAGRVQN